MPHFSEIWVRTYFYVLIQDSVDYTHFGHLHFTKNKAVFSWFGRPISNDSKGQTNQTWKLSFIFYFCRNCQILNPVLFGECQWYFKKVLCRKINRLDITIQPFSHKSLILIFIFFKDSVISLWKISQLDTKLTFFLYM